MFRSHVAGPYQSRKEKKKNKKELQQSASSTGSSIIEPLSTSTKTMFSLLNLQPSAAVSPEENVDTTAIRTEYTELMVKIAKIQSECKQMSNSQINFHDSGYENTATLGFNIDMKEKNDKLIAEQKLLILKAKALQHLIPDHQQIYESAVITANSPAEKKIESLKTDLNQVTRKTFSL